MTDTINGCNRLRHNWLRDRRPGNRCGLGYGPWLRYDSLLGYS